MSSFERSFAYLIKDEGTKFTDDPRDAGGATKFGVTKKSYESWLGRGVEKVDIMNLTLEDAGKFYAERYWAPLSCGEIGSQAVATCLFDSGVLYGISTCAMLAQKALNRCGFLVTVDASIGPSSVDALNSVKDDAFLKAFSDLLLERIDGIIKLRPEDEAFRKGWTARAKRLLTLPCEQP